MRARPDQDKGKQTIDWYKHQTGMRDHRKVKVLRAQFGRDGYCFWSFILEYLGECNMLRCSSDPFELELVAADIGFDFETFDKILQKCFALKLLAKDEEGYFFSPSLIEEMAPLFEKRQRDAQNKRSKRLQKHDPEDDIPEGTLFNPPLRPATTNEMSPRQTQSRQRHSTELERELEESNTNTSLSHVGDSMRAREGPGEPVPERERILVSELRGFLTEISSRHADFSSAWNSWVTHREQGGRQMTPEIQVEDLRFLRSQPNPVECIRFCIRKQWPALYPVKPEQYQAPTSPQLVRKQKSQVQERIEVASPDAVKSIAQHIKNIIRGGPTHEPA